MASDTPQKVCFNGGVKISQGRLMIKPLFLAVQDMRPVSRTLHLSTAGKDSRKTMDCSSNRYHSTPDASPTT